MDTFLLIVSYFVTYKLYLLVAMGVASVTFLIANVAHNPYKRTNDMFTRARRTLLTSETDTFAKTADTLSPTYSRMWRAYLRSGTSKPSNTFEFVTERNPVRFVLVLILGIIMCVACVYVYAFNLANVEFLLAIIAYVALTALAFCLRRIVADANTNTAKQHYVKFVVCLNNAVSYYNARANNVTDKQIQQAVEDINQVKRANADDALQRASEILRGKNLEGTRTAEQQQKLNVALNGLLQAFAKKHNDEINV